MFCCRGLENFPIHSQTLNNLKLLAQGWQLHFKVCHHLNWFVDINDVLTLQCNWHTKMM